jgi:hypothetical protein
MRFPPSLAVLPAAVGGTRKAPRSIVSVIAACAVGSHMLVQVDTTQSDSSSAQENNNDRVVGKIGHHGHGQSPLSATAHANPTEKKKRKLIRTYARPHAATST